ncbi:hypothetical protein TNIN_118951 [Trichonephila inaurata madagascariensis]|uniref:Uncharacterized protein n=1 Tax=Trichonephila inaurata madagascariensis TaxID=2747483 RepID=A0A8X7CR29_9ARAC|nr:hypothetical protein TNIN_118951 [Trichonephila inaurata madagascariensis]
MKRAPNSPRPSDFCFNMHDSLEDLIFIEEATFHFFGNVIMFDFGGIHEQSRQLKEIRQKGMFSEQCQDVRAANWDLKMDMLQLRLFPQLSVEFRNLVFLQQDGASPCWHIPVCNHPRDELPHLWIQRIGKNDIPLLP